MRHIITLFFLGTFVSFTQNTISGTITDENKLSLPFANVVLYKKGSFVFEKTINGFYYIKVSMLGF